MPSYFKAPTQGPPLHIPSSGSYDHGHSFFSSSQESACNLMLLKPHILRTSSPQDEGDGEVIAAKLRPISDAQDFDKLVASGAPVVVDFYAP